MSIPNLNRERGRWANQVGEYIDRIHCRKSECFALGCEIARVFDPTDLNCASLASRTIDIDRATDLCQETRRSLREKLTALGDLYHKPDLWSLPQMWDTFRQFIVQNTLQRAEMFKGMTDQESASFVNNQRLHRALAVDHQVKLEEARLRREELIRDLRGSAGAESVLDADQQREEDQLYYSIVDHPVHQFRNASIPIYEDLLLIQHLVQFSQFRCVLRHLRTLFRDSHEVALLLLSHQILPLDAVNEAIREKFVNSSIGRKSQRMQETTQHCAGLRNVVYRRPPGNRLDTDSRETLLTSEQMCQLRQLVSIHRDTVTAAIISRGMELQSLH